MHHAGPVNYDSAGMDKDLLLPKLINGSGTANMLTIGAQCKQQLASLM